MTCEKLTEDKRFLAVERMQENLDRLIEDELKKDYKLQEKIREIKFKAAKRIEKLKQKPLVKLRNKYNYDRIANYFKPNYVVASSSSSGSTEPFP
jgi:hypothetical protein